MCLREKQLIILVAAFVIECAPAVSAGEATRQRTRVTLFREDFEGASATPERDSFFGNDSAQGRTRWHEFRASGRREKVSFRNYKRDGEQIHSRSHAALAMED